MGAPYVSVQDPKNPQEIQRVRNDLGLTQAIALAEQRLWLGGLWEPTHLQIGLSNNDIFEFLFKTGADVITVAAFALSATGNFTLRLFEGSTTSDDGTPITMRNRNRVVGDTPLPLATFFHSPTVTGDGTQLAETFIAAGRNRSSASAQLRFDEWILAANTNYLVRMQNVSGSMSDLSIGAPFYELAPEAAAQASASHL